MTCSEAISLVEAIAAGDLEVSDEMRAHVESCPRCASALASARRIEAALATRPVPEPPARFADNVLARIRREQWRSEQHVDRIFNVGIVVAVLVVAGSVLAMTNVDTVVGLVGSLRGFAASAGGQMIEETVPTFFTYVAAVGLLMSALAMWWWAERRFSL
jgi:anti-sigma factor RsiW